MGLLDAKEYDPRPRQRLVRLILAAVVIAILAVAGFYEWPYYQARRIINKFFAAVEAKNLEQAYGIWNADPDWKQHPDRYSNSYSFNQFLLDWGPSSTYGVISSHSVECLTEPPKKAFKSPSGIIVVIKINNRADPQDDVDLWVEKKTGIIGFSPESRVLCR